VSGFSFLNQTPAAKPEVKPSIDIFAQLNVKSSIGARTDAFGLSQSAP
jgi:hypothetical protein